MKELEEFCSAVLDLDRSIRFVGVAGFGLDVTYYTYRKGITIYLDPFETDRSLLDAIVRLGLRRTLEKHLGDCEFILAFHKKVKKVTIPIRERPGEFPVGALELTLELDSDHENLVRKLVIPFMEKGADKIVPLLNKSFARETVGSARQNQKM